MYRTEYRIALGLGGGALILAAAIFGATAADPETDQTPEKPRHTGEFAAFDRLYRASARDRTGQKSPPGSAASNAEIRTYDDPEKGEQAAYSYYSQVATVLGFDSSREPETVDALLKHIGFPGLSAADVETMPPDLLMDPAALSAKAAGAAELTRATDRQPLREGEILAVRFFSPKTTDVSHNVQPVAYSWRKLVRFKARAGSPGAAHGVAAVYILSNIYESNLSLNPFEQESYYTQVIVTRRSDAKWPWSLVWLVFDRLSAGGKRMAYSETSWDAADPRLLSATGGATVDKKYYVYRSCVHCHGDDPAYAKLQYLDSDHWQDRLEPNDDFPAVAEQGWSALFDAGREEHSPQHARVMKVLRMLNREILDQNQMVDREMQAAGVDVVDFQTRAAEAWLALHLDHDGHVAPERRGIQGGEPTTRWDPNDPLEREIVSRLNRYCFRCHSSVVYHVFDKAGVRERVGTMIDYLQAPDYDSMRMPQDREFDPPGLRRELIDLLEQFKAREGL